MSEITHYGVLFTGKLRGKFFSELLINENSVGEAEEDAERLHEEGYSIVGIYAIDPFGGTITKIQKGEDIERRLGARDEPETSEPDMTAAALRHSYSGQL